MREGTAVVGFHRKPRFKSGLLIGAAGLAAAGVSSAAAAADAAAGTSAPADSPKWLPYASVGASVGDATAGAQANVFVPVWQDLDSLLFVRLGVGTQTRDNLITNFGLGYRTKIDPDWIFGVYGGFDASRTKYDHTFTQGTLGAELMSADWAVRINGYLSTADKLRAIANSYSLYIHDTRIAILQAQEGSYSGFDGEVGYRVFATDNADVRLFAGGFSFSRDDARMASSGRSFDFAYRDITGPMGRAEVDIYDIDALGTQSRITLTGQISHDDVRGTSGYVGASLRIPLGAGWGAGGQALDDLDRRMVDEVRSQDNVLTTWDYTKPEPVIIYNGSVRSAPTNTLYYAADDSPGTGSYTDPTSLAGATGGGAANPFIVVTDFGGPVTGGVTVHSGQTLVGGGQTFDVVGTVSGTLFSHDFAPASGTPTLVPATPGGDILTIDGGNASIQNLNFAGDFGAAIYGHNVGNVDIADVTIDGSGGGQFGIQVYQDMSQDMNLHISNSTITGLGVYGVSVDTTVSDGGTSNQTIELTNSTISGSGVADVALTSFVSGGSTVNQSIVIDPTYISGGYYGLLIDGVASGVGTYLYQNIAISDVTVDNTKYAGIGITGFALNGGTLNQKIDLTNVTVTGSYAPMYFVGVGLYGGQVEQQIDLMNVSASLATYYHNIEVHAEAGYGGSVHQFGTWTNILANAGNDDGVEFGANAYDGGTAIQNFTIDGLNASGNRIDGLDVYSNAVDFTGLYGPTVVAQYITLNNGVLAHNYHGVHVSTFAVGYYAATLQSVAVTNSTLSSNHVGIYGDATAIFGGSAQQIVTLDHDFADSNTYDGGHFTAFAALSGFASQTVNIYYSHFNNNGADGLYFGAIAGAGGNVEQNANIYFSAMDHNGEDGLHIASVATGYALGLYYPYYSQVTQNVIAAYDSFLMNGRDGAYIRNDVSYGGQLNQLLYFYGDAMNFNGVSGVRENSTANAYGYYGYAIFTNLYSDLYVIGSAAMYNGLDGITVDSDMVGPGYLIQHVNVLGTNASYNGRTGFVDYANAYGFLSLDIQYVTLAGSAFDGNGLDGAAFLASQYFGPLSFGAAIQDVTIAGSDFSGNYRDGLYGSADASGLQGRAEQHFTIAYSRFDYNGRDGIYLRNSAHDGVYLPGYGCGYVQGLYGGCAFVRQTVDIYGSELNYNGNDGLRIVNYAGNYGAIYGLGGRPANVPTVLLYNTSLSYNGNDGLELINHANNSSYIYQYVLAVDSHFDHNGDFGIEGYNYAAGGSQLIQIVTLYSYATGTTVDGNANGGVQIMSYSNGGYLYGSAMINQLNLIGADVSNNGGNGVGMAMYSYATYAAVQDLNAIGSTFVNNAGYGVGVVSIGIGDFYNDQLVTARGNLFAYNGGIGLGVAQYDLNSIYANQTVVALYNAFVDNVTGFAQGSYLVGTYAGSQESVLAGNYFTGGTTALGGIAGDGASILFLANNVGYDYAAQVVVDNYFHNVANDALSIRVDASAYSYVYNYTLVRGNLIDGAGGAGIKADLSASDYSLLTNVPARTGVVITGNDIYNVGMTYLADGIDVKLSASDYGVIVGNYSGYLAPFNVVVAGNRVDGVSGNGIRIGTDNYYGVILALLGAGGNTVSNAGGYGILVDSYNYGGVTDQNAAILNNTVTNAYQGGIAVYNEMKFGITYSYSGVVFNTVSGAMHYAGINVVDYGNSGTLVNETTIADNAVSGSPVGIGMYTYGDNSVYQYNYVFGNTLDSNGYGVVGIANGTTYQYIHTYYLNTQTSTPPANYYRFYAAPGATQVVL